MSQTGTAPTTPGRTVVRAMRTLIAIAIAFVFFGGIVPSLHGSGSVDYSGGELIFSAMSVPVQPTDRLFPAHAPSAAGDNLFGWTETSNGTRDAATGKPPIEYHFGEPAMFMWAPDAIDYLYFAGPPVLGDLIVITVLVLLWRMVGSLRAEVFTRANSRRMVTIGLLIGVGLTATALLTHLGETGIVNRSAAAGALSVPMRFSFVPLLAGAVIVAFAEVFRRGIAMREDLETVV